MAAPLMLKVISLLLLSAATSIASPALDNRQTGQTQVIFGRPVYTYNGIITNPKPLFQNNGNYVFVGCMEDEARTLISTFSRMGRIIENTVIPAISIPAKDPAQDPFLIFFSDDSQRNTVQNVFIDMARGATQTRSGESITRPMFVCVNDQSGPYIGSAVKFCKEQKDGIAFTLNGSVWLCPAFFTQEKPFPDPSINCPTVNYTKNAATYSDHSGIMENQFSIVMHELAHIYAPHPLPSQTEIYDINFACYSIPDVQVNNPNNYAYYATSIFLRCNQLPYIPPGKRSYGGKPTKRQSTSGLTNDSIPIINPERYAIDDVPASAVFPGFDINALQANLTALGYNLP